MNDCPANVTSRRHSRSDPSPPARVQRRCCYSVTFFYRTGRPKLVSDNLNALCFFFTLFTRLTGYRLPVIESTSRSFRVWIFQRISYPFLHFLYLFFSREHPDGVEHSLIRPPLLSGSHRHSLKFTTRQKLKKHFKENNLFL